MIHSPQREYEQGVRNEILKAIAVHLRWYQKTSNKFWLDGAMELMAHSAAFKTRIHSHDYTKDDEQWDIIRRLTR